MDLPSIYHKYSPRLLQDVEKFTDAIYEFDQISKLDKWKTSLLLRVSRPSPPRSLQGYLAHKKHHPRRTLQ